MLSLFARTTTTFAARVVFHRCLRFSLPTIASLAANVVANATCGVSKEPVPPIEPIAPEGIYHQRERRHLWKRIFGARAIGTGRSAATRTRPGSTSTIGRSRSTPTARRTRISGTSSSPRAPSSTVDGERVDMSGYHFHTNYEPSVSFGEPGTPRCKRGIHFPEGWDITLQRFENTAPVGEPPVFVEADRIENVTPQQIADGLRDHRERWRASREMTSPKPTHGNERDAAFRTARTNRPHR